MNHFAKKISYAALVVALSVAAKADPAQMIQQTLARNAQSGLSLQTQLSQNAYRQESYQDNYDVQVPYQDTEEYQDTETY